MQDEIDVMRARAPIRRPAPTAAAASLPRVTAIIPTACRTERGPLLMRAIDSLLSQDSAAVTVLVVVNGTTYDREVFAALKRRTDIRVHWREIAGAVHAQRAGRELVATEFFCFLDDDDVYLPGALRARLAPMLMDSAIDAVVGNGYCQVADREVGRIDDVEAVSRDPVRSLLSANWLCSPSGLFRTATVPLDFIDPENRFNEWTLLALRLATQRRVAFVPDMTFRISNTPNSLSKSQSFKLQTPDTIQRMLALTPHGPVRRLLRRKLGAAWHSCAGHTLREGNLAAAWRYHLLSLAQPGGLAYLLYSRKLLLALLGVRRAR